MSHLSRLVTLGFVTAKVLVLLSYSLFIYMSHSILRPLIKRGLITGILYGVGDTCDSGTKPLYLLVYKRYRCHI